MKDNLDWIHRDIKTINENYYQVIEGTISWGKTYTVNLFEKQLAEKDKEIERLNNIINDMDKQIDNLCNNQKREVDKLNNDIKVLLKENEAKEKVIKKQDYAINELEKWLKEFETKEFNYNFLVVRVKDIQDKLQELKDGNNE